MSLFVDLVTRLLDGVHSGIEFPYLLAGPLNDTANLNFYREIHGYLHEEFQLFGARLFERMMAWAGAASLTLLTMWITVHGYRITTGQSRDSMAIFVIDMAKAVMIVSVATGTAIGGGTVYDWACNLLPNQINRLVADHDGDLFESIDRTFGYMQVGLSSIGDILTAGNSQLEADKTRNQGFVIIGTGMPALVAGTLLLFYQAMLAMIIGFAPLGVLSLLFKRTQSFFWNWLLYLLSTLVALAVLSVMASYLLDVVCAVAVSFWAGKLMGSSPEGINSLALQQGGLGLIFTVLMIGMPAAAARLFKGLLGEFMPFSAFSGGTVASDSGYRSMPHPQAQLHMHEGELPQVSVQTHMDRGGMPKPAAPHEDQIKPAQDSRSFLERYPNATASLEPTSGRGEPLPESIRANSGIERQLRTYTASDIQFVLTERIRTPSGGYLERPQFIEPGAAEYEAARAKVGEANLREIANAVNTLGEKLAERGRQEEIETFNSIKSIAIEINPGLAHRATYSAKAHNGAIYINPEIYSDYSSLRQANRIAHEFRHLMKSNQDLAVADYAAKHSPAEDDAEEFAKELFGKDSK